MLFGLVIPFFDPYYNLSVVDHTMLSLKIWFALLLMFSIIFYIFCKILNNNLICPSIEETVNL